MEEKYIKKLLERYDRIEIEDFNIQPFKPNLQSIENKQVLPEKIDENTKNSENQLKIINENKSYQILSDEKYNNLNETPEISDGIYSNIVTFINSLTFKYTRFPLVRNFFIEADLQLSTLYRN